MLFIYPIILQSSNKSAEDTDWPATIFEKKRIRLQGTKKKGCAAQMVVKIVETFPDYKVSLIPFRVTTYNSDTTLRL